MNKLIYYKKIMCLVLMSLGINLCIAQGRKTLHHKTSKITIELTDSQIGDTLRLMTYNNIYTPQYKELSQPHGEFLAVQKIKGKFAFIIPIEAKFLYISIYKENILKSIYPEPYVNILREYLIAPNDDIKIVIAKNNTYDPNLHLVNNKVPEIEFFPAMKYKKQYHLAFSGRGSNNFKLRYLLDGVRDGYDQSFNVDSIGKLLENPGITTGTKVLKTFENKMNPLLYSLLKADFISEIDDGQLKMLANYKRYNLITQYFEKKTRPYSDDVILNSRIYPFYLISRYNIEYPIPIGEKSLSYGAYHALKQAFKPGPARDKILTIYVAAHVERLENTIIEDAKRTVKTPQYRNIIEDISSQISAGKLAYDFELSDNYGKKVRLSDFKGKVVFLDFWFTGCSACKGYYSEILAKAEEKFTADTNMVFISIAIDRKRDDWIRSVNQGEYTSKKAVNLFTNGKGQFDPSIDRYVVHSYPRPVLIGKDGKVITDKQTELMSNGSDRLISTIDKALRL